MAEETIIRMAELSVSTKPMSILTSLGLGSCIGVCAYDRTARVSGMAHVVLPVAVGLSDGEAKSADIAIPNLLDKMIRAGADKKRIRIAIAGGAQLFKFGNTQTHMDVGVRNIQAVKDALSAEGITAAAMDVGGTTGRTVKLHTATGAVTVRRVGEQEQLLVEL